MSVIDVTELVSKLNIAKIALTKSNRIEHFAYFWFDRNFVYAFDDILGVRVPFESDVLGGVRGDVLLDVLRNVKTSEAEMNVVKGSLVLRSNKKILIRLTMKPFNEFKEIWAINEPDWDIGFKLDQPTLESIMSVMFSVGSQQVLNPEQLGVTVLQTSTNEINFYSTDSQTASWSRVSAIDGIYSTMDHTLCIFPTNFCTQLKKFAKVDSKLWVDSSCVYYKGVDNVLIFSRLVEVEKPVDFPSIFKKYLVNEFIPIPENFVDTVRRIHFLTENENSPCEFKLENNVLSLAAVASYGEIREDFDVTYSGDVYKGRVDPELLFRALRSDDRTHMMFSPDCIILKGPNNFRHIVVLLVE